jgi:hypothetical protein
VLTTPAPATPAPATPAPLIAQATPAPVVVATPVPATPTPPPLDVPTVVRTPALWPPRVALVRPVPFPLSLNGKVIGQAEAPIGTALRVWRFSGQHVEVDYPNARHWVPVTSTDFMAQALATFRKNGSVLPDPAVAAATPPRTAVMPVSLVTRPVAAAPLTVAPPAVAAAPKPGASTTAKVTDKLAVEVLRMKRSRIEGGDFDDKKEHIAFKVKLANGDKDLPIEPLKAEFYVFAESILDRAALKLLGSEQFDFTIPPRGTHDVETKELQTMYDTTGARFGYKYEGWVLRLRDTGGKLVMAKASSPTLLKNMEKAASLKEGQSYDRNTFKEKADMGMGMIIR